MQQNYVRNHNIEHQSKPVCQPQLAFYTLRESIVMIQKTYFVFTLEIFILESQKLVFRTFLQPALTSMFKFKQNRLYWLTYIHEKLCWKYLRINSYSDHKNHFIFYKTCFNDFHQTCITKRAYVSTAKVKCSCGIYFFVNIIIKNRVLLFFSTKLI